MSSKTRLSGLFAPDVGIRYVTCNGGHHGVSVIPRVKDYRDKLRVAGLRRLQIWVPDPRRPGFAEECRRQSLMLRRDPVEPELHAWLEKAADTEGWR